MGAETTVYVKVIREVVGWVEVSAVTLEEAIKEVRRERGNDVVRVICAQYEPPYSET